MIPPNTIHDPSRAAVLKQIEDAIGLVLLHEFERLGSQHELTVAEGAQILVNVTMRLQAVTVETYQDFTGTRPPAN